MELIRLNKAISESGLFSRREADRLIEAGRVSFEDREALMGEKVTRDTNIYVDGKLINKRDDLVYIALNKPVGITCTTESDIPSNIVDFVGHKKRIFPIGRLDKPSEGLILLTNDGDIVNKILRSANNHDKEYIVEVDKEITDSFITGMGSGVPILDTITKKCKVEKLGKYRFKIILTEGLNRQIRRMCHYFGYEVTALKRVRIMNIELGNLKKGRWRDLSAEELKTIKALTENSIKGVEEDEKEN